MIALSLHIEEHRGEERLFVRSPYHRELNGILKKIPGARWSQHKKQWHFKLHEQIISLISCETKHLATIDLSVLREELNKIKSTKEDNKKQGLLPENIAAVHKFKQWMEQKRYSALTIKNYEGQVCQFLKFYQDKNYHELNIDDVMHYNQEAILKNDLSISYQNSMVGAIKLFYTIQDHNAIIVSKLQRPFKEHRLPEVLSKEEIEQILNAAVNLKHKALLSITYACGLRRGEVLSLKLTDLDRQRKLIRIVQSKGKKDRYVPFGDKLRDLLIRYYKVYKPKVYLFEGQYGGKYGERSFAQVLHQLVKKLNIAKNISLHSLRHSYATHLLEAGTDIRYIQELLGHKDPKTTMIYTHVSSKKISEMFSPFDDLCL